jgi:(1->4)-alpha-D-glucan 1-alpha-D-glucosylmutase
MDDYPQRIRDYAIKAVREAKVHTGWLKPDSAYEEAYLEFIDALFQKQHSFIEEFAPFQEKIAFFGMLNGLSQLLLKATSPGVPDFYQGCEFWDLSLVDPDNRRPVDYPARRKTLAELQKSADKDITGLLDELRNNWQDGRIKMYLTGRCLQVRGEQSDLFSDGDYLPLTVEGKYAKHLLAYARRLDAKAVVILAPRLMTGLVESGTWPVGENVWSDTRVVLPQEMQMEGIWHDLLSRRSIETTKDLDAGPLLQDLPLTLLINSSAEN